jgi:Fe-Mn family superoxide dismutase
MRTFSRLSSSVRTRTRISWRFARGIHQLKELSYDIEKGLGDFLPPPALKTVAVDYQQGLLDRLNDEVRGEHHVYV